MITVGLFVVILNSGQIQKDAAFFQNMQACEEVTVELKMKLDADKEVIAYHVECTDADTFFVVKKPDPKKNSEPLPGTTVL